MLDLRANERLCVNGGTRVLADILEENGTLLEIDIRDTGLGPVGRRQIGEVCAYSGATELLDYGKLRCFCIGHHFKRRRT